MTIRTRRTIAIGAVGVLAVGGIWLGNIGASADSDGLSGWPVAVSSGPGSSLRETADLVVRARSVRDAFVDIGKAGLTPGDFVLFEERLISPNSDRVLGSDAVRCELGLRTFSCEGTMKIRGKGKIRVAGNFIGDRDNVLPVTGGTGRYKGVGGQFRVFDLADGTSLFVFDLTR